MPNASRGVWRAVLHPFQWVVLHEHADPYRDPAYFHHRVTFHLEAEPTNTENVQVEVHESENGVNWRRTTYGAHILVPGGALDGNTYHVLRWVRVVLYSRGNGVVDGTWVVSEKQTLPGGIQSPPVVEVAGDPTITVGLLNPGPQQCVFSYDFAAVLDWEAYELCGWVYTPPPTGWKISGDWVWTCRTICPSLDLYVRDVGADDVTYYNNMAGANLTLDRDAYADCDCTIAPPETTAGSYTVANSFYVWYSERSECGLRASGEYEPAPVLCVKRVTITNTGTCVLVVNDTILLAGEVYTINDYLYAGFDTGDMSAWLGGTPVPVVV